MQTVGRQSSRVVNTQTGETVIEFQAEEFAGFSLSDKGRAVFVTIKTKAWEKLLEEVRDSERKNPQSKLLRV